MLVSKRNLPATAWTTCGQMSLPMLAVLIPGAKKQLGIAGAFGMRGGITLPIQGRGIDWGFLTFSTNSSSDLDDLGACLGDAMLLCGVAASRMCQFQAPFQASPTRSMLSAHEIEVLRWCATGKTSWAISEILRISERTVNFHLGRIYQRLGVRTRSAACAIAIAQQIIRL